MSLVPYCLIHRSCVAVLISFVALSIVVSKPAAADLGSCLSLAYAGLDPENIEKAASFALHHSECLQDLEPPEPLIPYAALSESMDIANQSGALGKVGLAFGGSYTICLQKFDLNKVSVKQLKPVLGPVCETIHLDCDIFEQQVGSEANTQIVSQVPLLSLLPCACAAATSGLGVSDMKNLLNKAESCSGTIEDAVKAIGNAAKGVYNAGKDAIDTVGCTVEHLWGGCEGDSPPPSPPTGISAATNWCAPYGGIRDAGSRSNQPDDFSVICNDGSTCLVEPGKTPRCSTAAQIKQREEQEAQRNATLRQANTKWCQKEGGVWRSDYGAKCRDGQCKKEIDSIVTEYVDEILKDANGSSPFPATLVATISAKQHLDDFEDAIAASVMRDPHSGLQTVLEAYRCKTFLGRKGEELCPTQLGFKACQGYVDRNLLRVCLEAGQTNMKYTNKLLADPTADPTVRMVLYGCKNFLGRASEELCDQQTGFEICKQAADRGLVTECIYSKSMEKYQPALKRPAALTNSPEQWLPEHRCNHFLGRDGQWLCPDREGYNVCLAYLPNNSVDVCMAPNSERRISQRFLREEIDRDKCVAAGPSDGPIVVGKIAYVCPNASALADCEKLRIEYSGAIECNLQR